jgi:hypothetical protein
MTSHAILIFIRGFAKPSRVCEAGLGVPLFYDLPQLALVATTVTSAILAAIARWTRETRDVLPAAP